MPNIESQVQRAAREAGVDPELYRRLIMQGERSYKGWQTSPAGARGPSQLMPGTAAGLEKQYGINTRDYYGNLLGGAFYLSQQLRAFGGDVRKAVAAYNAGPGNVQKYNGVPPFEETQRYVENVLGGYRAGAQPVATGPGAPGTPTPVAPGTAPGRTTRPRPVALPTGLGAVAALTANLGQPRPGSDALTDLAASSSRFLASTMAPMKKIASLQTPPGQRNIPVVAQRGTPAAKNGAPGIVALAQQYLGTPYSWGGGGKSGPTKGVDQGANTVGFDCSGFLQYLWYKAKGIDIGDYTGTQIKNGVPVPKGKLRAGDAVFFGTPDNPHHVGMYIGDGQFIEAPHTGAVVRIAKLAGRDDYLTARRYG